MRGKLLAIVGENPAVTVSQMGDELGISKRQAERTALEPFAMSVHPSR